MSNTTIREAIATSIREDRTVEVQATTDDVMDAAGNFHTDWCRENDGSIDMWGWSDDTPDDDQDWRLRLIPAHDTDTDTDTDQGPTAWDVAYAEMAERHAMGGHTALIRQTQPPE